MEGMLHIAFALSCIKIFLCDQYDDDTVLVVKNAPFAEFFQNGVSGGPFPAQFLFA